MAYDAADGYVLLFSGSSQDDTWKFAGRVWTSLNVSAPPPRVSGSMTYDAKDGYVLLFGGSGGAQGGYLNTTYFQDTWSFVGGVWTNLTPTVINSTNSPGPRYGASMAYDSHDGYVVLFGGDYERNFLQDTWKFVGGRWTNITNITVTAANTPPCRFAAGMSDDPAQREVVLFGGDGKTPSGGCGADNLNLTLSDTWTFAAGTWTNHTPTQTTSSKSMEQTPPKSWSVSMTYDASDGYVVLFGGIGVTDMALQQTWKFVGLSTDGDANWSLITPATYPPTSPPARFSANMVYDSRDGFALLFGGLSEPQHDAPLLGDVWTYHNSVWTNLTPILPPPYRSSMAMTYDQKDGYVLLFGGESGSGTLLSDTWKYVAGVWLQLKPPQSPPARFDASMAYDANVTDQCVVLFGGLGASGALGDTWYFVRGNWTAVDTPNSPGKRYGAAMAYDSNSKISAIVLFGGQYGSVVKNDTWFFADKNWTLGNVTRSPPSLVNASLVYDAAPGDHYLLLFGGSHGTSPYGYTWEFTAQGGWTKLSFGSGSSPGARFAASMVYDSTDGYVVLFGGAGASVVLSDTWKYVNGAWTNLAPSSSPPGRYGSGMVYDSADALVLLFSGTWSAASTSDTRNDTWAFSAGTWTNVSLGPIRLPTSTGRATGPSLSSGDVALIVFGALVLIVALLLILRRRRHVFHPTPTTVSEPAASASSPTPDGNPSSHTGNENQ
jgi:hypothetical protein